MIRLVRHIHLSSTMELRTGPVKKHEKGPSQWLTNIVKRKNNNGGQVSGQQFLQLHSLVFVFTYSFLRGLQLNSVTQKQIQEISTTRMEKG